MAALFVLFFAISYRVITTLSLLGVTVAAVTLYEMTIRYLQITYKQKLASTAQCGGKEKIYD